MSHGNCAPQDRVRLFKDLRAKKAIGMHWGVILLPCIPNSHHLTNFTHRTWILTGEGILDPPICLAEERKKLDIEDDAFVTCDIGETFFF